MKRDSRKLLLVEDEKNLAFNLQLNLKAEGFEVICTDNGEDALRLFTEQGPFAVIILDVMIPEIDGFEVAQWVRKTDNRVGILMLTARASDDDRVRGLSLGADDYLTKPFHLGELILRVKRMAERTSFYDKHSDSTETQGQLRQYGPFSLDKESLILQAPTGKHSLTALEADVLEEFLSHPEKTLSRQYLLNKVWGMTGNIETRTVDNFILRIRKLIEHNPARPRYLISIRGKGYRLTSPEKTPDT